MIGIQNSETVFLKRTNPSVKLIALVVLIVVKFANKMAVPVAPIKSMPIFIDDPGITNFITEDFFKDCTDSK
jgi:hypothetical protein